MEQVWSLVRTVPQRIRDFLIMHYINLHFTYLLTYLLTYLPLCVSSMSASSSLSIVIGRRCSSDMPPDNW